LQVEAQQQGNDEQPEGGVDEKNQRVGQHALRSGVIREP